MLISNLIADIIFHDADGYLPILGILYLLRAISGYLEDSFNKHCDSTWLVFWSIVLTNAIHVHTLIGTCIKRYGQMFLCVFVVDIYTNSLLDFAFPD